MIQLSSLLAAIPKGPVRAAAPASGAAGSFALPGAEAAAEILSPGRQILAAPGRKSPEQDVEADAEGEEAAPDAEDIPFAWFSLPVAPQQTPATPLAIAPHPAAIALDWTTEGEAPPTPPLSLSLSLPIAGDGTGTETAKAELGAAPARELQPEIVQPEIVEPAPIKLRVAMAAAQPVQVDTPATTAPQLAAALFAAAPAVASPTETRRTLIQDLMPAGEPTTFADIVRPHAVAAPTDVQQGVLDMRRREWVGQMVDHIDAMRDVSPSRETRLSLSPEALGKVDVSIRQDGDRIHVHFATETTAARQLLSDGQPRLSELAEARGVKLGQTSVDGGGPGQDSARQPHGNPTPQPLASRAAEAAEIAIESTHERIA